MHVDNLEVLRKEAVRLIRLESALLGKISGTPGLLSIAGAENKQTLDSKSSQYALEVLAGEKTKLENMDMVVAVVGTMKAGKSTTINAIVGAEILPNRNAPMTAIPTLIRHSPGKKEPKLLFENNSPINDLFKRINEKLTEDPDIREHISHEAPELADALAFVGRGEKVNTEYVGQSGIFEFLKSINDLVRICRALNIEFPFDEYDEMHELPVIEVEFASLSDKDAALGRLTLLDTPGPNEAGQKHLRGMLSDQLRKASAVIAVLNYSQLKSQGDQDLQDQINEVETLEKGRVYAFVNRFDERGRNDPDEESIKRMVNRRFDNDIAYDNIFAVSAWQAFLSELAQRSVNDHGQLPDADQPENAWVEDFGSECFGKRWASRVDDIEEISEAASELWSDSGFETPVKAVIHSAHQNAAYYALDSTAAKLVKFSEQISNFINSRDTALSKTALELQKHIDSLREDAQRVAALRDEKELEAEKLVGELRASISVALADARKEGQRITQKLFKEGVVEQDTREKEAKNLSKAERDRKGLSTVSDETKKNGISLQEQLRTTRRKSNNRTPQNVVDPNERELEFAEDTEAEAFLTKIEKALEAPVIKLSAGLGEALDSTFTHFNRALENEIAQKAGRILTEVSQRLGDDGFNISLSVPSSINSSVFKLHTLNMRDGVKAGSKLVTRLQKQESTGSGVKRFFGDIFGTDWGYDEYKTNIKVFRVSLDDLNAMSDNLLKKQEMDWQAAVQEEVELPINAALESFFGQLEQKVEGLRGDLLQGVVDKEKSKREQDDLLTALKKMNRDLPALQEDSEALQSDTQNRLEERTSEQRS